MAITPLNERFAALLRRVSDADSVVVVRLARDSSPGDRKPVETSARVSPNVDSLGTATLDPRDSTRRAVGEARPQLPSESRPDRSWGTRFARVLGRGRYYPDLKCRGVGKAEEQAQQPVVLVHAYRGDRQLSAEFNPAERCVNVSDRTLGDGSVEMEDAAEPLLDLVREALPQDPVLHGLTIARIDRSRKEPPPPAREKTVIAPAAAATAPRVARGASAGVGDSSVVARARADTLRQSKSGAPPAVSDSALVAQARADTLHQSKGGAPSAASDSAVVSGAAADTLPKPGESVYIEVLPEAVTKVAPEYPVSARESKIEGTVMVQTLVGRDGLVHDTKIVKSIAALDSAAVASVRQWRFKPAMSGGKPVATWVAVPVKFTLR
jgi:protein TonB